MWFAPSRAPHLPQRLLSLIGVIGPFIFWHNVRAETAARKTPIQFDGFSPLPRPAHSTWWFLSVGDAGNLPPTIKLPSASPGKLARYLSNVTPDSSKSSKREWGHCSPFYRSC